MQEIEADDRENVSAVPARSARAPQPAAWGVFLSLLVGIALILALVCTLVFGQSARLNACLDLARKLAESFSSASIFEEDAPTRRALYTELTHGLASLARLEPWVSKVASLWGDPANKDDSFAFEQSVLQNIVTTSADVSHELSNSAQLYYAQLSHIEAPNSETESEFDLPARLQNREQLDTRISASTSLISASQRALAATLKEWANEREKIRSIQQQIELVRIDAGDFFGMEVPLAPKKEVPASIDSFLKGELLSQPFYRSGLLAGIPTLPAIPDGVESADALKEVIQATGGSAQAADGQTAEETKAKLANLQATGSALLQEAEELEQRVRSLLAQQEAQVEQIKLAKISWLQVMAETLISSLITRNHETLAFNELLTEN